MAILAEPAEILDLGDGASVTLKVQRLEVGEMVITQTGAATSKTIPVLRVHVEPGTKPAGLAYWDVTSKTLQAQLKALAPQIVGTGRAVLVTKIGVAPRARFTVTLQ